MPESTEIPTPPRSFLLRLAGTIGLPWLVVFAGEHIPISGVQSEIVETMSGSHASLGIFALGIAPILSAYMLVEAAAFIVPRWRGLRHGNPRGRAKLETAARLLAIVLAVVQAFSTAQSLAVLLTQEDPVLRVATPPSGLFIPLAMVTLVGGVCLQFALAGLITRLGLMNGIVALGAASYLASLVDAFGGPAKSLAGLFNIAIGEGPVREYEPRQVAFGVLGLVVGLVATWVTLRDAGRVPEPKKAASTEGVPYRDREARQLAVHPYVPLPSSSYHAHVVASALLMLPASLMNWGLPVSGLMNALEAGPRFLLILFVTTALVAVAFSWVMHRPAEMADLVARLGGQRGEAVPQEARVAWRRALIPSLVYFGAVVLARGADSLGAVATGIIVLPALMDFMRAVWIHELDLVPIWEERRASAVPVIRAALGARGIAVETQGIHVLGFWQAFAPYAPARLLVQRSDAKRARAILKHLFLGDAEPRHTADEVAPAPLAPAGVPWSASRRNAILVGCAAVAGLVFAGANHPHGHDEVPPAGPRAKVELLRIDDAIDPLGKINDEDLPEGQGIAIYTEHPRAGKDVHMARITLREGETLEALQARFRPWLASIPMPEGTRLGVASVTDFDVETNVETVLGMRTYVLTGEPILTTEDIVDAVAAVSQDDGKAYVGITLSDAAATRFERATAEWKGRRIAILVDDVIDSAPLVQSAIGGGRLSITMGQSDTSEVQLAKARALAERLKPR